MWKIVILFLLFFSQPMILVNANRPYRVLYPYGLLSNDFGILNVETDLAVDTWRSDPHPYDETGGNGGYSYWS